MSASTPISKWMILLKVCGMVGPIHNKMDAMQWRYGTGMIGLEAYGVSIQDQDSDNLGRLGFKVRVSSRMVPGSELSTGSYRTSGTAGLKF